MSDRWFDDMPEHDPNDPEEVERALRRQERAAGRGKSKPRKAKAPKLSRETRSGHRMSLACRPQPLRNRGAPVGRTAGTAFTGHPQPSWPFRFRRSPLRTHRPGRGRRGRRPAGDLPVLQRVPAVQGRRRGRALQRERADRQRRRRRRPARRPWGHLEFDDVPDQRNRHRQARQDLPRKPFLPEEHELFVGARRTRQATGQGDHHRGRPFRGSQPLRDGGCRRGGRDTRRLHGVLGAPRRDFDPDEYGAEGQAKNLEGFLLAGHLRTEAER